MKQKFVVIFLFFLIIYPPQKGLTWGFWGHKRINRMAVFTLPSPLIGFYKNNIEFITEHAVDPDKRRYAIKEEAPRHYIDLDRYCTLPCDSLPHYWKDAVAIFSEDTLNAHGIVPWHVTLMKYKLTEAFKEKDAKKILKLSAEIGHYIGDAHVPLHTTKNYNGQLSNQKGIHGFWESRIPELLGEEYDYFTGTAFYIDNPQEYIWKIVLSSHAAVDSVLRFERELNNNFSEDQKYAYEDRNIGVIKTYSSMYAEAFNKALDGQVERRMRLAIVSVGSFWYSCWVDAGQPDITDLNPSPWTEDELKEFESLNTSRQNGKIYGQEHED